MDYLRLLLAVLVFPGLLFTLTASLILEYLLRKTVARMQKRMGPKYTGPFGVFQAFADFFKLIREKEIVANKYSMPRLAEALLILGISSLVTALLFLPLSPYPLVSSFDFFIYIYLCCLVAPLMLILASLSMPGPYTSIGVSRILTFITICEPSYFIALLIPVVLLSNLRPEYSIYEVSSNSWSLWLNPLTIPLMALSLLAAVSSTQAKAMLNPFNIPEAEQEIIAGFETEFSGPILGLARLYHDADYVVSLLSITYIVLGGPYPFRHLSLQGVVVLLVKFTLVFLISSIIRASTSRVRVEQALDLLFKYSLTPSLAGIILASLYVFH
ncbi:complex I subunit 1 family protein [Thermogladius sp. 4427co]|uniref:complex I subunit 1 family protein n=1 Tax=Thermogladius sp. 4427co TaxID=3450718 RepID=UPI003F7913F8